MSVRNWSYYYKENRKPLTKEWFVDTISLGVAVGLVWCALFQILGEYFPAYVEVEGFILLFYVLLLWLPSSGLLDLLGERWNMAVMLGTVIFPLGYIAVHYKKMPDGILAMANVYLYRFNPYQGTNFSLPQGEGDCVPYVMTAILMILWMALWGMAHFFKRPIYLVLFPITGIMVDFLVGQSPEGESIWIIFIAAFLLMIPKGTKLLRQVAIVALAVVSISAAEFLFEDEIDEFSSGKESIERFWEDFEFPKLSLGNLLNLDFSSNTVKVDNNKPNYTGKIVFSVSMDMKPSTSQYFRGFCATDYKNGVWKWNPSAFRQACEDAGYLEENMAKCISGYPFFVMKQGEGRETQYGTISMEYVGLTGDTVYVPYMYDYNSFDDKYSFTGDYLVKKDTLDKNVKTIASYDGDLKNLSLYTYYSRYSSSYEKIQWYNSVARNYTNRSENMECINEAADYIANNVTRPREENLWMQSQYIMYDSQCLDAVLENIYRMRVADKVREYLEEVLDYSMNLDRISSGTDPVEYALTKGNKGYCMHYASAAVLIFKELGIPARYASGYVVRPSDYKYYASAGEYVAQVEDYNSHAWAEIYLENIGWVPIEVTEGYDDYSAELPTKKEPEESSESQSTESESIETASTEEPTEDLTEEPTEEPTEETTEKPTEETTEEPTEEPTEPVPSESQNDSQQGGGTDNVIDKELWDKVFKAAGVLILVFGFIYGCKLLLAYYDYVLKKEIDGNKTRHAVKRINKRIARIIRLTNRKSGQLTDALLEELLKKNYPQVSEEDWNRYMEIVKKMHYSHEKITHEEMMHVYWCYKNI
ncbi:MAG: transglutaminase-like domain-containing protein [Agathobacter sp.]